MQPGRVRRFSVQNFWEHGKQAEISQGINFADAAKQAGVTHFVYSSVASADKNTGIPHFDSSMRLRNTFNPYSYLTR